jgi:hypothetical protein
LCRHDQIHHARHESPPQDDEDGPLDLALLPLLRRPQRRYNVAMLDGVIRRDARRKRIVVGALPEEAVCQGKGDQAGDGQDEEGEKLAL